MIVDVDDFINEISIIKPKCEAEQMTLIISNSCFEIWLYYGRKPSKPTDFVIPSRTDKISSGFKTYLNSKIPGGIDPRKAIFDIENAIINAKKNYEADENGVPKFLSTNMYVLADRLLVLIKPELEKEIEKEKQKRTQYPT